jgi:hypothetical protein
MKIKPGEVVFRGGHPGQEAGAKKNLRINAEALKNTAATYSPGTKSSTIGHEGLNFSVRYGKR